jgi:hypothetical protein
MLQGRPFSRAPVDQRKDPRYQFDESAQLSVEGLPNTLVVVRVLDISKAGLRARVSVAFPVGTRVEVLCRSIRILGQVRYLRNLDEDGFNLGIQADSASDGAEIANADMDLTSLLGRH